MIHLFHEAVMTTAFLLSLTDCSARPGTLAAHVAPYSSTIIVTGGAVMHGDTV
ncbi:hypothetical protein [Paraburkholderia gardini]|uniref:hypothetical protein n=1 Tax=Paraburkholderia gardini TaxID=2823469 RepID=UPI001E2ADCA3|nr:hypothetical protein [Paraburkholderia gardini]